MTKNIWLYGFTNNLVNIYENIIFIPHIMGKKGKAKRDNN